MHPVDIFVDPLTLAKFHQVLVYGCGLLMRLMFKSHTYNPGGTSLSLILKMI